MTHVISFLLLRSPTASLPVFRLYMESEFDLLREENARLLTKITGLEFETAELIERVAQGEEKQLENVELKNLLLASQVSRKT